MVIPGKNSASLENGGMAVLSRLHIEVANSVRGHQADRFGLEHGVPIGATVVQDDTLE